MSMTLSTSNVFKEFLASGYRNIMLLTDIMSPRPKDNRNVFEQRAAVRFSQIFSESQPKYKIQNVKQSLLD